MQAAMLATNGFHPQGHLKGLQSAMQLAVTAVGFNGLKPAAAVSYQRIKFQIKQKPLRRNLSNQIYSFEIAFEKRV